MSLRRYIVTRAIHGFQVGDRFLVDGVDGAVTMVRQEAWTADALRLAELNGFAAELLAAPQPAVSRSPAPTPRARPVHQRKADR